MKKPLVAGILAASVAAAGLFTLAWEPVEGGYESLRVKSFHRILEELSLEHTSVELNEDYIIDPVACIGCRICVSSCPVNAISITDDNKAWIDPDLCIQCGACVATCPVSAIVTVGMENIRLYGVLDGEETPITTEFTVY